MGKPIGRFTVEVTLEGRQVQALLDTGCGRTLVQKVKGAITGEQVTLKCIHGDIKTYPTKVIKLYINDQTYWCMAGVVPNLDTPLLIDRDCPILCQLVEKLGNDRNPRRPTAMIGSQAEEFKGPFLNCVPRRDRSFNS